MKHTFLASVGALAAGILLAASPAQAITLLSLINAPPTLNYVPYSLSFTATSTTTTLTVEGFNPLGSEYVEINELLLNDVGANLLGALWTLGVSGSSVAQFGDGASFTRALEFYGADATAFQTIATTVGDSYTYDFSYDNSFGSPSGLVVTTDSTAAPDPIAAPEPASMALLGTGLLGLSRLKRRTTR